MDIQVVTCYTDGSYNKDFKVGAWVAIIFYDNDKTILKRKVFNTNHNRLELIATIEAIKYIGKHIGKDKLIKIYSDSQYVTMVPQRKARLKLNKFKTAKGKNIQNVDLIIKFINLLETLDIELIKVKAHQKKGNTANYNHEVDKLSRKIVRDHIRNDNLPS